MTMSYVKAQDMKTSYVNKPNIDIRRGDRRQKDIFDVARHEDVVYRET